MNDQAVIDQEKQLVQQLAGIKKGAIELNDIGWTSRVYLVDNGRLVFKFPRSDVVKKEYEQEVIILKLLEQADTNIQLPKIRWTHPNNDYIGYEGIIGRTLDEVSKTLEETEKQQIGTDIGNFLKQLHNMNYQGGNDMSVEDEIAQFQSKYLEAIPVLERKFTADEQVRVKQLITEIMPKEMRELGGKPVVCHGDLGYWNIVYKGDGMVGLIDFGDIGNYDQSKDLMGLSDQIILDSALNVYGDSQLLRKKIAIRRKVLPVMDISYFESKNNTERLDKTLVELRQSIN